MENWFDDPLDVCARFFDQQGISYDITDGVLQACADKEYGQHKYRVSASSHLVVVESVFPLIAGSAKRILAVDFAHRANSRLPAGSITADVINGSLGMRSTVPWTMDSVPHDVIVTTLTMHLLFADRVLRGLAMVIFDDVTPRVAVERCLSPLSLAYVMGEANQRMSED